MSLRYRNGIYTIDFYSHGRGTRIRTRLPAGTTEEEAMAMYADMITQETGQKQGEYHGRDGHEH